MQVMVSWLLAYITIGQYVVPVVLALFGIYREDLSGRGAALLHLSLDIAQLLLTLAILARCLGRFQPKKIGLFNMRWDGGKWLWWVAVAAASFPVVDWLAQKSLLWFPEANGYSAEVLSAQFEASICHADWITGLAYFGVVGVCAPLWEELIFRGFLLASLTRFLPPAVAAIGSALVFAVCHFRLATFAPLLVLGVGCGAVYLRTNNLLAPIVLHSLWNMFVLATLAWRTGGCSPFGLM